ncbi:TIGR02452 family protein [Paenibacillus sp. sgz5001063]|uniref:TIGR02452 family protein n=1 Tax=Paenibacillus sp. sgz5001063 TaxID=3242474 RepID=UPI0036D38007
MNNLNPRNKRAAIAQETLDNLEKGNYVNRMGRHIDIAESVRASITDTMLYAPDELPQLNAAVTEHMKKDAMHTAKLSVTSESTLEAAYRLVVKEGGEQTVCLNFASAKNPGGGFLGGSQAQEESLARASALYLSIAAKNEMYQYNRGRKTCLYSHYMIHSPKVPVIRDSQDQLLDEPYVVSFITAPAVNAGVVREREPQEIGMIPTVMLERIRYILAVAANNGHKTIVLGAYGCGVFRNNPSEVAEWFRQVLLDEGYQSLFNQIVFAVLDHSPNERVLGAFRTIFNA